EPGALELAEDAAAGPLPPLGLAGVEDEPALPLRDEATFRGDELRLGNHRTCKFRRPARSSPSSRLPEAAGDVEEKMRRKRLLVAASVAAAAAAAAIVALVSGSASADNTVINFSGSYGPGAACAARFDFPVGANTTTIDVAATADVPANDIVLNLYYDSELLGSSDTATSPEAVHYAPGGVLTAGTYSAEVCPFDASQNNVNTNYRGSVVLTEVPLPSTLPQPPSPKPAPAVSFDT